MRTGDYIIAKITKRGECKKDRRYKVLGIIEKGHIEEFFGVEIIFEEEAFYLTHNGRMTISNSSNFVYDYRSNRILKLKRLQKV